MEKFYKKKRGFSYTIKRGVFNTDNTIVLKLLIIIFGVWQHQQVNDFAKYNLTMTVEALYNKLKTVDLRSSVPELIQETSYEIETLNKSQLFNYGVDSNDRKLKPAYSGSSYAKEKSYMNRRPGLGQPDLFFTGSFYKGFTVSVTPNVFTTDSIDSKSVKLEKQYGSAIFGLTKNNIKIYATGVFYTRLQKFITLKTGLQFK